MTENLREYLTQQLEITCPRVYNMDATDTSTFPYLVYDLIGFPEEGKMKYQFEIDIWDRQESSQEVETIAKEIKELFDETVHKDENQLVIIYLTGYKTVREDDKLIKRRMLTFEVSHYERS